MLQEFSKIKRFSSIIEIRGDKSISHRAVMFSALAKGKSVIYNLSNGEDVMSTIRCFRSLGVEIENNNGVYTVNGLGFKGLKSSNTPIDAGNSGTTARLMSGILSAQDFKTTIVGDASLSQRPMKRVVEPLSLFGASIDTTEGKLPMTINPVKKLKSINYQMEVASAQVKSALILAALHLEESSIIKENEITRNHTEAMLNLKTVINNGISEVYVSKNDYPEAQEYVVPADISSAAFMVVLTLLNPNSELVVKNVSLNPTRTGYIDVLKMMGADIQTDNVKVVSNEKMGDIIVKSSKLTNVEIPDYIIPNIIDEIPILTIAGLFAEGDFKIKNAKELRVKESDRIMAMCQNIRKFGIEVEETADGYTIKEKIDKTKKLTFDSYDDHRIAMSFSILSMLLENGGFINDFDCVKISNPKFLEQIEKLFN